MYWNLLKPILIGLVNKNFEAPETKCRAEKQSERVKNRNRTNPYLDYC